MLIIKDITLKQSKMDKNPNIKELTLNVITQEFTMDSIKAVRLADRINEWHQAKTQLLTEQMQSLKDLNNEMQDKLVEKYDEINKLKSNLFSCERFRIEDASSSQSDIIMWSNKCNNIKNSLQLEHSENINLSNKIKELQDKLAEKEKELSEVKKLNEYILEIDWLTTTEFCDKFNVPPPRFTGEVESSVNEMLRIDAIKHRMFVEKAKEIRKNLTPTSN